MRKVVAFAMAFLLLATMIIPAVMASELVSTEVVASIDNAIIVVEQGQTVDFVIHLTATGSETGSATSSTPDQAAVDTNYSIVGATGSSSIQSAWYDFFADTTDPLGGPNYGVTWTGDPNPYEVTATAYASPTATLGDYSIRIDAVFSNPSGAGGKLGDSTADYLTIRVIASTSAPLSITAPDDVTLEGNTTGGYSGPIGTATASGGTSPYTITNNAPNPIPLGTTTVTWTVTDDNGDTATDTQSVTIVDTTPPTITIPATLTVLVNAPKSELTGSASDIVDASPTLTNDAPSAFPAGITIVTWTATDASGNVAYATTIVTANYNILGFLQPIDMDGSSVFKLGSTVPTKFQLTDYYGNYVSTAVATLKNVKFTNVPVGEEIEVISTSAATTGNLFRYDMTSNQYIFNLGTKTLSKGGYQITAYLDSGQTIRVIISLK